MTRLWFVVPAHGREQLTKVCLRQLARTCDALRDFEIEASAVVVADDGNLDAADEVGFATVRRDNEQLGRRFNDGYQLACDPDYNPRPVEYVVPCGSDDWVDPQIFARLPPPDTIGVFHRLAMVDETRTRLAQLHITYRGGAGVRVIPAGLLARVGYRPAEEDRKRAVDTSTVVRLTRLTGKLPKMVALDVHPLQIVDWKSPSAQLNSYESLRGYCREETTDPFESLAAHYPAEALEEMQALA